MPAWSTPCRICARSQHEVKHHHASSMEAGRLMLEAGKRTAFCAPCSRVHPIEVGFTGHRRIVLTSSTFADWARSGHDSISMVGLSHWETIALRGSTFCQMITSAIGELEKLDSPMTILVLGGVFNSAERQCETIHDIRCAMLSLMGFLHTHQAKWASNGGKCQALFGPLFIPPCFLRDDSRTQLISGYNLLCVEFNVLNGFNGCPSLKDVDRCGDRFYTDPNRVGIKYRGHIIDTMAYREKAVEKMKHLTNNYQHKGVVIFLRYLISHINHLEMD